MVFFFFFLQDEWRIIQHVVASYWEFRNHDIFFFSIVAQFFRSIFFHIHFFE